MPGQPGSISSDLTESEAVDTPAINLKLEG